MRSVGKLKKLLDSGVERASKSECKDSRGNEYFILDSVDRLAGHSDECSEIGLREIVPGAFFTQAIPEMFRHSGVRGARAMTPSGVRRRHSE